MGEVELPVLSGEISIEQALDVMRLEGRSGIVTTRNTRLVVLTDEDLIDDLRVHGNRHVAEVAPGHRTLVVTDENPRFRGAIRSLGMDNVLDEVLRWNYGHFSLQPTPGASRMRVRTVAETFANALSQPVVVCTCTTDAQHKWRPPQLNDPGKCNLDGDPVNCR